MISGATSETFRLRWLFVSVYLPGFIFSVGMGATVPIAPLLARDLGASLAVAGLTVAMIGLGEILTDLPGGVFVSRFGDKAAMLAGALLASIVAVGATFAGSPIVLMPLMLLTGASWTFWELARWSYLSEVTPVHYRGRAISLLGGVGRAGNFVGPVLGGLLGASLGLEFAFFLQAALGMLAALLMFVVVREPHVAPEVSGQHAGKRLFSALQTNRAVFLATFLPLIALATVRQGRIIFLPLWGDEIDLDVAAIGIVYGFSYFVDAAMFYPVGLLMDTKGRKWTGVPCLAVLGVGLMLLPLTSQATGFVAVALLMGLGNGFGAGIVMTLGADLAPNENRGEFLGVWRLISDLGSGAGPLAISAMIAALSLGAASLATGGFGLLGAAVLAAYVGETLKRPSKPL